MGLVVLGGVGEAVALLVGGEAVAVLVGVGAEVEVV